ncbi:MAG: hypothetical protein IJS05_00230 [Paludibacteraceae bacterium]|nr:hypothetical protein [Paludibacteraceae bacterium]
MKRIITLSLSLLSAITALGQEWVKEVHPTDEMLNKPAFINYKYKDSKIEIGTCDGCSVLFVTLNERYNCFSNNSREIQVGFYDAKGKYLRKKSVFLEEADEDKKCFVIIEDKDIANYLLNSKGSIRIVAKGYYADNNIDLNIPCLE